MVDGQFRDQQCDFTVGWVRSLAFNGGSWRGNTGVGGMNLINGKNLSKALPHHTLCVLPMRHFTGPDELWVAHVFRALAS